MFGKKFWKIPENPFYLTTKDVTTKLIDLKKENS